VDLIKLSDPFPAGDIEWRVAQAGVKGDSAWCQVLAYITARAIQARLDEVCGPENWKNEPAIVTELRPGTFMIQTGISILLPEVGEWVTKWDVAEPTSIEAAKGGFSGAMKRAGAQWGIGRYLYHLDATFAKTSNERQDGWQYAKLPQKFDNRVYYWQPPQLPGWALPKEPEHEVSKSQLGSLKKSWMAKLADGITESAALQMGFDLFVKKHVGEFPAGDHTCWTTDALQKCERAIACHNEAEEIDSDVPFGGE